MSPNKIGSDLRSLYAVGSLDDYELLKKQVSESQGILAAIEAVLKDRLSSYRNSSPSQVSCSTPLAPPFFSSNLET